MKPKLRCGVALVALLACSGLCSCQSSGQLRIILDASPSARVRNYKRQVEEQLGPIWHRLLMANSDALRTGTVTMTFEIASAGGNRETFS